jgi:pimeloyl-ACP methyl ester carboxylesterase
MSISLRSVSGQPVDEGQDASLVSDRRVRVDGMDLQYLEAGSGPPLLLLHGHEQSATSWRWVLPALARTHRVLALSLPGHGESGPAVNGYAPGRDLAPLVADFLDTLGVGSLHVVGNSVGGAVALRVALADPARVRTLTLVDSAGLGRDVNPLLALNTLPMIGELAIMISRMPGGDVGRTSMSTAMLFAQPSRVPAQFFTEQHAVAQAQAAVDRLPDGRLALLADCGHLPHVECPDRFATVLSTWLAEHPDPS